MFTGIIEQTGKVLDLTNLANNRLVIQADLDNLMPGESIAVNGVCLTLLPNTTHSMSFDVSHETLNVTNLSDLQSGDQVNLERALLVGSRFGGHYVTGHIDTTAQILSKKIINEYIEYVIGPFSKHEMRFLLPKGSVTLDGVSLTLNNVIDGAFSILLVPHTCQVTNLEHREVGDSVNIEFDHITRVIAHQSSLGVFTSGIKNDK